LALYALGAATVCFIVLVVRAAHLTVYDVT
jgi:hypothetical protein